MEHEKTSRMMVCCQLLSNISHLCGAIVGYHTGRGDFAHRCFFIRVAVFLFLGGNRGGADAESALKRLGVRQELSGRKVEASRRQKPKDHAISDTVGKWHENDSQEGW